MENREAKGRFQNQRKVYHSAFRLTRGEAMHDSLEFRREWFKDDDDDDNDNVIL